MLSRGARRYYGTCAVQEQLFSNGIGIISLIRKHLSRTGDRNGKKLRDCLVIRNFAAC
jgi:hypothetical protein